MSVFQNSKLVKQNVQWTNSSNRSRSVRGMLLTGAASLMLTCGAAQASQPVPSNQAAPATKSAQAPSQCSGVGHVWWNELLAPETDQLSGFYSKVFGWSKTIVDVELQRPPATSPDDKYFLFKNGQREVAGLMRFRHPDAPSTSVGWFVYIQVANVEDSVVSVQANGGTIMYKPVEMADGNTIAVVRDPMGNVFGLVTPANATNC
jgi:uncharacterized protein